MQTDLLTLSTDVLELQLSPSVGGAIARLENVGPNGRTPVLRKGHSPLENVLDAPSFPLVPYVNRIRGGSFAFRGRTVTLRPNMAGDPSPLHGDGWLNPWGVEQAYDNSAVLTYRHEPGEWPWAYEARQEFRLDGGVLDVRLLHSDSRVRAAASLSFGRRTSAVFRRLRLLPRRIEAFHTTSLDVIVRPRRGQPPGFAHDGEVAMSAPAAASAELATPGYRTTITVVPAAIDVYRPARTPSPRRTTP